MADEVLEDDPSDPPPRQGLEHFVRENPIAAILGALVAGIMLGRLGIL